MRGYYSIFYIIYSRLLKFKNLMELWVPVWVSFQPDISFFPTRYYFFSNLVLVSFKPGITFFTHLFEFNLTLLIKNIFQIKLI